MKVKKYDNDIFDENYLSVAQILIKLADPTFLYAELGRASGKTSHILAPRIDRVQNDMPGAVLLLGAPTYKLIADTIVPGILQYFKENYERGIYFEVGKKPRDHFKECCEYIDDWKHTISFHNGAVIQFVSADRPESALGKNGAHLFVDEMLRISEEKFTNRVMQALRADRSKFGHSHYFMGVTGTSSSPDMETDETWFLPYEKNMNKELIESIQEIAYHIDLRYADLFKAQNELNIEEVNKCQAFIARWEERIREFRRGETYYIRASSFSNIKILGIEYIENQIKSLKNVDELNSSIFAVRKNKVKDRFFGKFGKQHLFDDGYEYKFIDKQAIDAIDRHTSKNLKYCDPNEPLYVGYDPGPFSSLIVAQRNKKEKKFRIIKTFYAIHPDQQQEIADQFAAFFINHKRKVIFLHYDRAANQRDPKYRDYYKLMGDISDTDAILLKEYLDGNRWNVQLMSLGAPVIFYSQHYRLLSKLFGKNDGTRDDILVDEFECEDLVSSINMSPLKRNEGKIILDKSSEKLLEYKDQRFYSTQMSSAFMYLLWGEFNHLLPESDRHASTPGVGGTWGG